MIKYIDKNKLIQRIKQEPTDGMYTKEILSAIDEIETADAVEVVRCKNCKKWNNTSHICGEFITNQKLQGGGKVVFITEPDDFCSYGIRKEQ